jgi:aldehyde:ferredoxin oxidoreductase
MHGFYNMVLRINLAQESYALKMIPDDILAAKMGGKGLAAHLLLSDNPPGVDPLSPENHLVFAMGPVSGSPVWGSCRHGIFTKSPQTGLLAESYFDGKAAECMAATGYDAIVIRGAAERPIWLEISEEAVYFHPAEDLWRQDDSRTKDAVRSWINGHRPQAGPCGVVAIGPAGEKQGSFTMVENDSAGRAGIGAVIGAKRIKAIAFRGRRKKTFADPGRLQHLACRMDRFENVEGFDAAQKPEPAGMVDADRIEGQVAVFVEREDRLTLFDTLILCRSYCDHYPWEQLAEILHGATGLDLDTAGMRAIAAAVGDDVRRFNLRDGLIPEDDRLLARFHKKPLPETGKGITEEQTRIMLAEYYRARGWNDKGEPEQNKI